MSAPAKPVGALFDRAVQAAAAGVPRNLWRDAVWSSDLKPLARLLALTLAAHMQERDQTVWLTYNRAQERTGMSRASVARSFTELQAAGFLRVLVAGRQHQATKYVTTVPPGVALEVPLESLPETQEGDDALVSPPETQEAGTQQSVSEPQQSVSRAQQSQGETQIPSPIPSTTSTPDPASARQRSLMLQVVEDLRDEHDQAAEQFLDDVSAVLPTSKRDRHELLLPLVAGRLRRGWSSSALLTRCTDDLPDHVKSPGHFLADRLRKTPVTPPGSAAAAGPPRPTWCGDCDERTRLLGEDAPVRCPACHPQVAVRQSA